MRTNSPSRKRNSLRANFLLTTAISVFASGGLSGCAVLSIPSYRVGHSSQSSQYEENIEGFSQPSGDVDECEESGYVPVFPTLPRPKFVKKWKERQDLPEGPNGLRFHPLPTRPMFSPRSAGPGTPLPSTTPNDQLAVEHPMSQSGFGAIPQGAQWSDPGNTMDVDSAANANQVNIPELKTPDLPSANPTSSNTEELPAPK